MSVTAEREAGVTHRGGRWIENWEPDNPGFWESTGRKIANRNLIFSILTEHIAFSIWSLFSVLVLFMGPKQGFGYITVGDKFVITSLATAVGSVMRIPYNLSVARVGGRNWTIISALLLLIPSVWLGFAMHPGTSYGTFLVIAAFVGFGGGNFASSMTNINTFYPEDKKGSALGLNAGGGNLGVAVVQLVGLAVLATAGVTHPKVLVWIYIPLIVVGAVLATLFMDNIASVKNDSKGMRHAVKEPHTWVMSFLYIGTFGSFIGYSFAFGQVLQNQFKLTPVAAAGITFLGPLLGSLSRPVGGWLSDKIGGAKITGATFVVMALCAALLIVAAGEKSLPLYDTGFILLFVFSGVANGSTYKMIPAIFRAKAKIEIASGAEEGAALLHARKLSGAVIGIAAAIGAFGGVLINIAFRQSFLSSAKSGTPAVIGFLVFYAVCFLVTWAVYLRPATERSSRAALAAAQV
ncbi:MAG TPA: nitrate/nitrite transporter [Pseudonocardiaceae bacterium]|jgi:NNP family nitrate/nitrite transporter-like MFS transporter|nr:nitrate/nitrite transporter [Pseudonocardiaceae bacterium]